MGKFYFFIVIVSSILIAACSSSQVLTYRPAGSNEKMWDIRIEKSSIMDQFEVIINDSTVIEETPNMFTNSLDVKSLYRGKEVKLLVNYSTGCLGIGSGYNAILFIDNEMAGQFSF
jgi:hypothetical protein